MDSDQIVQRDPELFEFGTIMCSNSKLAENSKAQLEKNTKVDVKCDRVPRIVHIQEFTVFIQLVVSCSWYRPQPENVRGEPSNQYPFKRGKCSKSTTRTAYWSGIYRICLSELYQSNGASWKMARTSIPGNQQNRDLQSPISSSHGSKTWWFLDNRRRWNSCENVLFRIRNPEQSYNCVWGECTPRSLTIQKRWSFHYIHMATSGILFNHA